MIRRSFLTLLFAILLMFGQQQSMVHAYVHAMGSQQQSKDERKSTSHSEVCGKCVALANLAAAVSSQAYVLDVASGQLELSTELYQTVISARFSSYHSRAPPILS